MIAYVFLGIGGLGGSVVVIAVRWGYGPAETARRLVDGSGVRRITARHLRHELRLARHELAGAGQYIAGLERDRRELSGLLEERADECQELKAGLEESAGCIADLERQLAGFDATCAENTRLRAELANATAMRQLLPGASPADDASALPDEVQEFIDATRPAWRASA